MTPTATQLFAVAVGSAAGGICRWLAGLWLNLLWHGFPLGTLAVNVLGGLLVGGTMAWLTVTPHETWRLLLVTGFLGGFTTFSAFSFESLALLQHGRWGLALLHLLAHVIGALGAAVLGWALVRVAA
jgi:fluoride exporter